MTPYYLSYAIPALLLIIFSKKNENSSIVWFLIFFLYSFYIGLRHDVGGDWAHYLRHFSIISTMDITTAYKYFDPAHALVNKFVYVLGGNIYVVNTVYAIIFMAGLIQFCRRQPIPMLAFAVAVPYVLTVIAMGYTRQSAALGILFFALSALGGGKTFRFVMLVVLASLFHKSAAVLLPLAAFTTESNKIFKGFTIVVLAYVLYDALVADHFDRLWENYVERQMHSSGALIRVMMNFIPAALFFMFYKRFKMYFIDFRVWRLLALAALACIPLVFMASTATDRIALYLTPLQIAIFGRLPVLLSSTTQRQHKYLWFIVAGYASALFVWLNFATHAHYWVPYKNALFL